MKNSVLFVDDDTFILAALRRAVVDEDYVPYFTTNAQEALAIMEKTNISVVVTDLHMPKMDGIAMLKIVKKKYPDMQKIVLSGFTQLNQVLASINDGDINKYITKPWEMEDLLRAIREAIAFYTLKQEKEKLGKSLEQSNEAYKNVFKMMGVRLECVDKDAFSTKAIMGFTFSQMKEYRDSPIVITLCEMLCSIFLDSVPSYPVVFNLQKIKDGISKAIRGLIRSGKFTMDIKDVKCHGNVHFIIFVFRFLAFLSQQDQLKILDCNITAATIKPGEITLQSNLEIEIRGDYALRFLQFLVELCNTYDHIFSIKETSGSMVISIEQTYTIQS